LEKGRGVGGRGAGGKKGCRKTEVMEVGQSEYEKRGKRCMKCEEKGFTPKIKNDGSHAKGAKLRWS